jgi:hypothetical protein
MLRLLEISTIFLLSHLCGFAETSSQVVNTLRAVSFSSPPSIRLYSVSEGVYFRISSFYSSVRRLICDQSREREIQVVIQVCSDSSSSDLGSDIDEDALMDQIESDLYH